MDFKLGYVKKNDNAKLKFRTYMGPALPPPPATVDWSLAISQDLGMMGNDQVGDCTCADVGHSVMLLTAMGAGIVVPTTDEVEALYSAATGYVKGDESTDRGASLSEIADYVQKNGFMIGGILHKIRAYVDIDTTSVEQFKQSIYLFKHASIGFKVSRKTMQSFGKGTWTDFSGPFEGSHDVPLVAYDAEGPTSICWGAYQKMTWEFLLALVVEGQARLYDDAAGADWNDANGFSFSQLEADLAAI